MTNLKSDKPKIQGEAISPEPSFGLPPLGSTVADRYHLLSVLGQGAMGTVYRARHILLNREVAIKMLRPETVNDEISRKRFENEALSASSLKHSNLIAVTDYGFVENGAPYLIMDYVEGVSLSTVLKEDGSLSDPRLLRILSQVCAGLAHAHERGLVHRDLKPGNILLTTGEDGQPDFVKIVDFGLAKPIVGDQNLTHTGQIFGTPLYMSPEQCQGKKLDGRSDIYSLGCLMYRILCGRPPFTGENPVATIIMHVKDEAPPVPPDKATTDFQRALKPIIATCLHKDPALRFQSAQELREQLHKAATNNLADSIQTIALPPAATEVHSPQTDERAREAIRRLAVSSLICFIAAVAVVAVLTWDMLHEHPAMERQGVQASKQLDREKTETKTTNHEPPAALTTGTSLSATTSTAAATTAAVTATVTTAAAAIRSSSTTNKANQSPVNTGKPATKAAQGISLPPNKLPKAIKKSHRKLRQVKRKRAAARRGVIKQFFKDLLD